MLTVVCVYRPGGGFSDEYVYRLKRAVERCCSAPHEFVCLTNQKLKNVRTIPFIRNWMGYWSKIEVFRKDLFDGPVVYLDLDTALLNDCTDIFTEPYKFAAGSSWKQRADSETYMNSSVMAWDGRLDLSHIFTEFDPKVIPEYEKTWQKWGDQAWTAEHLGFPFENLLKRWPGRIVHTKTDIWGGQKNLLAKPPAEASIVAFSGRPRPHQLPAESPLYKAWVN